MTSKELRPIPTWSFLATLVLILLATFLDGWVVANMPQESPTQRGDFLSLFRILGYLPTWILFSILLVTAASPGQKSRCLNAAFGISITALVSGAVAEGLKPLFRRPDPQPGSEGSWQRTPFGEEWWDGTDFCFPSGHSAVAFGATLAICRRWPGTTPWMFLAASGCAATRILERGHHPSDVLASLLVALLVSHMLDSRT